MTAMGGSDGFGVIFTTNPDGSDYRVIHHFDSVNGSIPESKLVKALNGKFYGTTLSGGTHNDGVLFEIDQSGNFSKKIDFHDATIGSRLQGALTLGHNGKLYGATWSGGTNYDGTIFEYDVVKEKLTKLADLDNEGHAMGAFPFGSLVLAYNGKLFGTCYAGGTNTLGVIFELDPTTGVVTKKFDFDAITGGRPAFNMTLATNGKLYGANGSGGAYGYGTIFVFDPIEGTCVKVHDFDGPETGAVPLGTLTLAYNGKLYGSTSWGGQHNNGTLFEFDYYRKTIVKRFDFDEATTGKAPRSGLLQSSNGKLYGTTEQGGIHSQGVMFEFDPRNGNFVKKLDFTLPNGGQVQSCEMTMLGDYDRAVQRIDFDLMQTHDIEKPTLDLPAMATSKLSLLYYSSDPEVASVSENQLKIHKIGTVTITATQPGNAIFEAAPDVSRSLRVDSVTEVELISGIEQKPDAGFDVIVKENPFKNSLRFQVNSKYQTTANVVLYTMRGERLYESVTQTNTAVEFHMDFNTGMYLLGVQSGNGRKVVKVVCMN